VGQLDPLRRDSWTLDAVQVAFERPVRLERLESGFVIRGMAGTGVTPLRSTGFDLGDQADLVQAYGILNVPTDRGGAVQISVGRMATMLGYEVIESPANPNVSFGNQYVFVENVTYTGADVNWIVNPRWSLRAVVHNGWDRVRDDNSALSTMGRVCWTPDASTSVAVAAYVGPEQPGNADDLRRGAELLVTRSFGSTNAALQLDAGDEEGIDAGWQAAGIWASIPVGRSTRAAFRADILLDRDGARTSGALGFPVHDGIRLATLTATLDVRPTETCRIRPEVRWDSSDHDVFGGNVSQIAGTLGFVVTY
jgi:hypothetical protein